MGIFDGIGAWGNLNAHIYLEYPTTAFYNLVDDLIASFGTKDVYYDSFDLASYLVSEGKVKDIGETTIAAAHLHSEGEGIIAYHYQGLCSVEHFFRPWVFERETGSTTIRKLIADYTIMGWVLGFELSVGVEHVRKSFDTVWGCPSEYPLIVFEQGKYPGRKEYGLFPGTESEQMLTVLRNYEVKIS